MTLKVVGNYKTIKSLDNCNFLTFNKKPILSHYPAMCVSIRSRRLSREIPALSTLAQTFVTAPIREHRLCPHALVFAGLRWHTRAFSYTHHEFRDFVLARIHSAESVGFSEVDASEDVAWETSVPVKMGAHPGLSDAQKAAVEFDYGMVNGVLAHKVRIALLPYFLRTMRIGTDDLTRDAMVQQIALLNREDLKAYLSF